MNEMNCKSCGITPPLATAGPWVGHHQLFDFCTHCLADLCDECFRKKLPCDEAPDGIHVSDSSAAKRDS